MLDVSVDSSADRGAGCLSRLPTWQESLRQAVRDPRELCRLVGVPYDLVGAGSAVHEFPVFAPREYIARMRVGDPRDPLLQQVLPLAEELTTPAGFGADPVGDLAAMRTPGLLHKYHSRVLMVTTGACAVHCRYCFRRHFPYSEGPRSLEQWHWALEEIASDDSIDEVILSGGDPLTLVDGLLRQLTLRLAEIPHLRRLRVHTRLPIVIPQRVTPELLDWLRATRLTSVVVIHANHANELDDHVAASLARLAEGGVLLLNQSVLLRGINDDLETLVDLSRRLVELRVMPYYLHQLDRVRGAAHFEVDVARGRQLMAGLRARLPGYAVPRYVQEIAGAASKVVLG